MPKENRKKGSRQHSQLGMNLKRESDCKHEELDWLERKMKFH